MSLAGKESVAAYWKQRLDGMSRRGLSTMSVMSDDTLTVASDGFTSGSNSHSSPKYVGKRTCPNYKKIPGDIHEYDCCLCFVVAYLTASL
jgi:hypothetical protein